MRIDSGRRDVGQIRFRNSCQKSACELPFPKLTILKGVARP
jgi:hypothetical protein